MKFCAVLAEEDGNVDSDSEGNGIRTCLILADCQQACTQDKLIQDSPHLQ